MPIVTINTTTSQNGGVPGQMSTALQATPMEATIPKIKLERRSGNCAERIPRMGPLIKPTPTMSVGSPEATAGL